MSKKKRVLFLLLSLSGGGAERSTLNLLKLLDRSKYEGYLGVFRRAGPYLHEVPTDVELVDLQTGHTPSWLQVLPIGKLLLPHTLQLKQKVDLLKPDIVISNMPDTSLPTYVVRLLSPRASFRWIAVEWNNTRMRLERVFPNKLQRLYLHYSIRLAYAAADHVIAISKGVKQGLVRHFKTASPNITVIHNPIDIARIQKEAREPISFSWPEEKVILGVGKLTTKQKGFDVLIQAFAKVRRKVDARLIILGRGEQEEELKALARRLGLEAQVSFPGWVSNPWAYMARSDLFVLSSRWEGFGNVIVEAMACGTPVIATDCDYGPGEIITHGNDGLLVPVDDVEKLAEAIYQVLNDRELSERLKQGGYRRALDFDVKKICSQYEEVFERVIENGSR